VTKPSGPTAYRQHHLRFGQEPHRPLPRHHRPARL